MVVGKAKVLDISRFPRMSRSVDWQQSQQIPTISFFWARPFVLRPSEDQLSLSEHLFYIWRNSRCAWHEYVEQSTLARTWTTTRRAFNSQNYKNTRFHSYFSSELPCLNWKLKFKLNGEFFSRKWNAVKVLLWCKSKAIPVLRDGGVF